MPFYVYFLKNSSDQLYIGQTNNLKRRGQEQFSNSDKTAKFVKSKGNFKLVYHEVSPTRVEAMRREKQLKGWTRAKKEALIRGDFKLLKKV
ncbi:GIY-YIG nuclease family protein [Candidatus Shapirobacteria bacterium]|nr:GIY-YIG nuclease family protein [Candidatus Shapirobacteria bacterium]